MSRTRTVAFSRPGSPRPRWDRRPFDHTCLLPVAATGVLLFELTCAVAALPQQALIVRPMLGILLAIMFYSRVATWPALIFAGFVGQALAGAMMAPIPDVLGASAPTAVAATVGAYGWKALSNRRFGPNSLVRSAVFVSIAAVAAPIAGALVSTTLRPARPMPDAFQEVAGWILSDLNGVVLVAWPTVLALSALRFGQRVPGRQLEACLMGASAVIMTALLIRHGVTVWMLLLQPLLMLATFRLNGLGLSALLAAAAGTATICAGLEPVGLTQADILTAQIFLALAVLNLLSVAIILEARQAAMEAAVESLEDSVRANRAKSDFLATVSHDIRTPLASIVGFTDLLGAAGLDTVTTRRVKLINDAGQWILSMVDDIQKFSMLDLQDQAIDYSPTQLRDLLRTTVAFMEPQARARGQSLRLSINHDVPEWVAADAPRLRQVVTNLISNAVKFSRDGHVDIVLRRGREMPDRLFFAVRDSGPGMTQEEQSKLFRPLMRLDNAATRAVSGTGLGLAICRRFVELMPGGVIGVTSSPGQGSTFWFEVALPACPDPGSAASMPGGREADLDGKRHILVAEDFIAGQKLMEAILEAEGHTATFVNNGQEAVIAARTDAFDLILMDLDMPVMDGLAATMAIRRAETANQHIPIIALTGSVSRHDLKRYGSAGLDGHLAKPVDIMALRAELLRYPRRTLRVA